jgi:transmembrane sensor
MKDFRLFDISDFVMDEDFIRWVNMGKKADNDFWDNWLNQNPDKYMAVAEARRILESIGTEQKVTSAFEKRGEIERLLVTIRGQSEEPELKGRIRTISNKWWYAAAVFIGLVCVSIYFLQKRNDGPGQFAYSVVTPSKRLIESVNTSEKTITLKLPDESIVELAPNSRIGYENNFDSNSTRDIYLSGEAFFKVTKNPARPFRVFANEIVTKVLGTSFIVRSFETDTVIQITVKTGKVSIYSQATANPRETASPNNLGGIILTPNQELVYQKALQKFQKVLLNSPSMILPADADKILLYEDVALEKVFTQLENNYGIHIVYDNEALKKCTINADLRNVPFYEKLDLICKALGATYEVMDGQIIIEAKGCE